MDVRLPKYYVNQKVKAVQDIFNDGSYPAEKDKLLINSGMSGVVVQTGHHSENNIPVYMVDFENKFVVGCFEEEIIPVES